MKRAANLIVMIFCGWLGAEAQMPDTEIWLFDLKKNKSGGIEAASPENISNRKGYDNQPSFSADGRFIYYSTDQHRQAEVYAYSTKKKKAVRLTQTEENEYSPRPVDGTSLITTVTVEKDSAQRLHFLSAVNGALVKKLNTDSIGYYCLMNADTLVFYKLTEPHSLRWRTIADSGEHFLASRPARCFFPVNRHALVFGITDSASTVFYIYDFTLRKATVLAKRSQGVNDLFWHPALGLLVPAGTAIERYSVQSGRWETLVDLGRFGITRISRFCIDTATKRLVVVDNPK